uniref:Uncharacterized protein n=1 Tax=Pseudo-nitzschia delicatissima TaxID=44447 RepID=A0A6U0AH60_9STRA
MRLTGSLTHLSALASKTSHALLLPLLTHTRGDSHAHFEFIVTLESVGLESSLLKNIGSVHEANLVGGDEFRVLDLKLEGFDGGGGVNLVGGGSNKNLHCNSFDSF